jgi:hypothetical protein
VTHSPYIRTQIKSPIGRNKKIKNNLLAILLLIAMYGLTVYLNNRRVEGVNDERLVDLEPQAQQSFSELINRFEKNSDWKIEIVSARRTKERQAELKEENAKNASPESSKHVKGLAIDINLYNPYTFQRLKKSSTKIEWQETKIHLLAEDLQIEWGGNYRTYHDPVHFEIND